MYGRLKTEYAFAMTLLQPEHNKYYNISNMIIVVVKTLV